MLIDASLRQIWNRLRIFALIAGLLWIGACSTPPRLPAVPVDQTLSAHVPGIPNIRYYWEDDPQALLALADAALAREKRYLASIGHEGALPVAEALSISGGGDNGAFGAGLLVGWTEAGNRPSFKLVTGISTGSLTAPFAFLGSGYDAQLREVYTTITPDKIYRERGLVEALFSESAADNAPLRALVANYATEEMLRDIAAEYEKGRLFLVGTTNFDARRPVIWDMGAIASSEDPGALQLFRDVLVASASIPGAFPPMMIEVMVDGRTHQEMHVDGGVITQAFVYPPSVAASRTAQARERRLYVLRNARLEPDWASVERSTLKLAARAVSSLIDTQGVADLYQLYVIAERDKVDFNLAYIPDSFDAEKSGEFDQAYMNALFDFAYEKAAKGYRWLKYPPGYDPGEAG